MAKKKKWPYKHLDPEKFDEYRDMDKEEVINVLKSKVAFLEEKKREKKSSQTLKDLRAEIKAHRDNWNRNDEIEELQDEIKALKEKRDAKIHEELEDKKSLEGGFSDHIKACEEHRDALLFVLRFHK